MLIRTPAAALIAFALTACGGKPLRGGDVERLQLVGDVVVERSGARLRYRGEITLDGVAALKTLGKDAAIDELAITSSGGEINAGMDLGEWVFDRGVTVVVDEYCLSSCANYVFPAAWQKVLSRGAVVAWHGSARQPDLHAQLVRVVDDQIKALALAGKDRTQELERRRQAVTDYLGRSIARQDSFFERIGVSEYVTRVGRERYGIEGLYTLPVQDMARFGIVNVLAPDGDDERDVSAVQQKLEVRVVRLRLGEADTAQSR